MAHTLATGDVLIALMGQPEIARRVLSWHGEAELRGWPDGEALIPDLLLRLRPEGQTHPEVGLHVEVDRGTEARGHWRKKLSRYLYLPAVEVLIATTSVQRAANLVRINEDFAVPLRTVTFDELRVDCRHPGHRR